MIIFTILPMACIICILDIVCNSIHSNVYCILIVTARRCVCNFALIGSYVDRPTLCFVTIPFHSDHYAIPAVHLVWKKSIIPGPWVIRSKYHIGMYDVGTCTEIDLNRWNMRLESITIILRMKVIIVLTTFNIWHNKTNLERVRIVGIDKSQLRFSHKILSWPFTLR